MDTITIPATKKQRVASADQCQSANDKERSVITDDVETPLLNGKPIDQCILEAVANAGVVDIQQLVVSSVNTVPIADYVTTNWAYPLSVLEVSANSLRLTYSTDLGNRATTSIAAISDGTVQISSGVTASGNVSATNFLATDDISANGVTTANLTVTGTTTVTQVLDAMGIRVNGISVVEYTPPPVEPPATPYLASTYPDTPRTSTGGKVSLSGSDLTLIGSMSNAYIGFRFGATESLCVWPGYSLTNEEGADMAGRYNKNLVVNGNLSVKSNLNGGTNGQEGGTITCQSITVNGDITADTLNDIPLTEYVTIATLDAGVPSITATSINAEEIRLNGTPLSTIIEYSSGGAGNTVDSFTGNLQVGGNLHCAGEISATSIRVNGTLLDGTTTSMISDENHFTGNLTVAGSINASGYMLNGTPVSFGAGSGTPITDEENHFTGSLSVDGEIDAHDLKVDGTAISLYRARTGWVSLENGETDVDIEAVHGLVFATFVLDLMSRSSSNPNLEPVVAVHDMTSWDSMRGRVYLQAGNAFIRITCQNQESTSSVAYTLIVDSGLTTQ